MAATEPEHANLQGEFGPLARSTCTWKRVHEVDVGFDHINRNTPVLIRTPKLTRFEPAQYWGGGPPGNSVVLNPSFFFSLAFSTSPAESPQPLPVQAPMPHTPPRPCPESMCPRGEPFGHQKEPWLLGQTAGPGQGKGGWGEGLFGGAI